MKYIFRKEVDVAMLKENRLIIFGEMHTKEDRDEIEHLIRLAHKVSPIKRIITEEAGPNIYLTSSAIERGLKNEAYSISDRSFKLGLELNAQVIGCDLWGSEIFSEDKKNNNGEYTDCKRSFYLREKFMIDQIMAFANPADRTARTVMIVGGGR